jgi:DNA-binding transcriptional LysR family regulator
MHRAARRPERDAMELRHLRYFVAVAEDLHFRRAADRLHVAQPAVSEQIRKLEQELGVQLFDRSPRGVTLTHAGAAMLEEARRVLRQADVAVRVARSARDRSAERLRVGYLADCLPAAVTRGLRRLGQAVPNLEVQLEAGNAHRLVEDLRLGRFDAVVTSLPAPVNGLNVTPLGDQHVVAALPAGHAQAISPAIVLEWSARERLIVLPREVNPPFYGAVVAMCAAAGLSPAFVTADSVEQALVAVSAGVGIALLPESAAERGAGQGVRFLPVRGAEPAFACAVLSPTRTESPIAKAFLRAVSQAATRVAAGPATPRSASGER